MEVQILTGLDGKEDPSARARSGFFAPSSREGEEVAYFAGCSLRILKKLKASGFQIQAGAKPGTRD